MYQHILSLRRLGATRGEFLTNFFVNIVPNLGINTNHSFLINTDNENDPIEKALAKYKNHTLKKRKSVPCRKKKVGKKKVTTDLFVFFQLFEKFTKGVCKIYERSRFF